MRFKIQHLGLDGVLNQAIAVVKSHFGLLIRIMLIAWVPFNLISGLVQVALMPQMPPNPTPEDVQRFMQGITSNLPITLSIMFVAFLVVLPLTNAAVIYAVAELYLGRSVTAMEAIRKGASRLGPLIWTTFLITVATLGGMVFCVVPGILFGLWFGLGHHVTVLENISGPQALGRSKQLVQNYLGQFLVLGLIVAAISIAISVGTAVIPQQQIQVVVNVLVNAVLTVFSTTVFVVFYFSCRCGVENFDLEYLAAAVGDTVRTPVEPETGVDIE